MDRTMREHKRLMIFCFMALVFMITVTAFVFSISRSKKCYINLNIKQTEINIIPDEFLSFGIDASELQHGKKIDFTNKDFLDLAAGLAPAHLRIGGTMSDRLIFIEDISTFTCEACRQDDSKSNCRYWKELCYEQQPPYFVMTGEEWYTINNFAKRANLRILFTLNVLLRIDNAWDEQNARDLISFTKLHNFSVDWQLGNEPNSFKHVFNVTIEPKILALDFKKLNNLLNELGLNQSIIVGPDTTRPQSKRPECLKYMVEFLGNGSEYINVRSWHQYYLNSKTATEADFWKRKTFDLLEKQIIAMKTNTKTYNHIPMWLSETSTAYGGGAAGLSNTYCGSPLWLDKLGLAAKYNITTVIRQSLVGGNYGLINSDYKPLPDWWISAVYKKVVGDKVLQVDWDCSNKILRFYAHCTNRKYTNDSTAITIYGLNLGRDIVKLNLNGSGFRDSNLHIEEFVFSAPRNDIKTTTVNLNGWPVIYKETELEPRIRIHGRKLILPPFAMGFFVIKNTLIDVCI